MRTVRWLAIVILIGIGFVAGFGYGRWYKKDAGATAQQTKGGRRILYYIDPMHPRYKSDKPGIAPDCGMRLEPVYADEGPAAAPPAGRKVLHYRDPKDSKYTSDKPGLNPETGNELEPVYAEEPSAMPPGTVRITPERQQLIGVRYGTVEYVSGSRTLRAVGRVAMDETRIARVHAKVDGWIEKVFVDFTGELVKKGQPLLTIYSPELLATQEEYLLALKAKDLMKKSTVTGVAGDSDALVEAARRRLELWDLTAAQIDEIRSSGKPVKSVTLFSPVSGYVTTRNAFPNQRIMPDTELYGVVDLSRVWIMADVFEYEAPNVRLGQGVTVSLSYHPGKSFRAKVSYIQPQVDPMTRTLKVRLEAENPGMLLKPDMYVDVEFRVGMPSRLSVPAGAVLDSGERKTVFVDRGNGYLEPRHVQTGAWLGDRIEILEGLKAGERIVTSGTFLVDSESQLKAAVAGMAPHQHGGAAPQPAGAPEQAPAGGAGGHTGHGGQPK